MRSRRAGLGALLPAASVIGAREAEVLAQRAAFISGAKNATLLQERHDAIGKILQAARQNVGHQVKAIGGAGVEPMLDVVGDLLLGPDDHTVPAAARKRADQLSHRIAMPPGLRDGCVKEGMVAIAATR